MSEIHQEISEATSVKVPKPIHTPPSMHSSLSSGSGSFSHKHSRTPSETMPTTPKLRAFPSLTPSGSIWDVDQRMRMVLSGQSTPGRILTEDSASSFFGSDQKALVSSSSASIKSTYNYFARSAKVFRSRKIKSDEADDKVLWTSTKEGKRLTRRNYFVFLTGVMIGLIAVAATIALNFLMAPKHKYCMVLEDNFDGPLDTSVWKYEQQTGGFGNSEFEWTTTSPNNSFVSLTWDLYITFLRHTLCSQMENGRSRMACFT